MEGSSKSQKEKHRDYMRDYARRKSKDPEWLERSRKYKRDYMRRKLNDPVFREADRLRKQNYRRTEKGKATEAAYQARYVPDPQKAREHSFKRHHGVARGQADQMIQAQENRCAICGRPPNGKGNCSRLHLDHDAITGQVRAMLCSNCNRGLGFFMHSVTTLAAAITYLSRFTGERRAHEVGTN